MKDYSVRSNRSIYFRLMSSRFVIVQSIRLRFCLVRGTRFMPAGMEPYGSEQETAGFAAMIREDINSNAIPTWRAKPGLFMRIPPV